MSKEQIRILKFAIQYPGWHTMSKHDTRARRAMNRLAGAELLEVAKTGTATQFRLAQAKVS